MQLTYAQNTLLLLCACTWAAGAAAGTAAAPPQQVLAHLADHTHRRAAAHNRPVGCLPLDIQRMEVVYYAAADYGLPGGCRVVCSPGMCCNTAQCAGLIARCTTIAVEGAVVTPLAGKAAYVYIHDLSDNE